MKVDVAKTENGLEVRIEGMAGREQRVLEKIRNCRSSAWACPSGECLKVAAIDERLERGWIVLRLSPNPGEELSSAGIQECLRYMLQGLESSPKEARQ